MDVNSTHEINIRIASNNNEAIHDNNAKVVRSPKLAAIGVATLSGFMLQCRDTTITATITRPGVGKQDTTMLQIYQHMHLFLLKINSSLKCPTYVSVG
jgi:hypothetical protein